MGGTAFVTAAQAGFVNTLVKKLPQTAPTVDPLAVVATGATDIRRSFGVDEIDGIVKAYMAGIQVAMAVAIGAAGVAAVVSLAGPFQRLNAEAKGDAEDSP